MRLKGVHERDIWEKSRLEVLQNTDGQGYCSSAKRTKLNSTQIILEKHSITKMAAHSSLWLNLYVELVL